MSDTLFADDKSAPTATDDNQTPAAQPTLNVPAELAEMIGDGKKYANVEAALASIVPAQNHISNIEGENAQYKTKLESNDKLDTILQKLNQPTEQSAPTSTQALNVGDIVNAVKADLQQEATVATKASNRASVEAKMTEKFGEAAPTKTVEIAQQLGMSITDLTVLCEASPNAALQLMGVEAQPASQERLQTDRLDGAPIVGDPQAPKTVMFGASSEEIMDVWRASAPSSN